MENETPSNKKRTPITLNLKGLPEELTRSLTEPIALDKETPAKEATTQKRPGLQTINHITPEKSLLNEILTLARTEKASDVHISSQNCIIFRQYGQLKKKSSKAFTAEEVRSLITEALPPQIVEIFDRTGDAEYVHTIPEKGRFRMSLMKQRNGWDLTVRLIPTEIPTFESSGMPAACSNLTKWSRGMVLITGPAGCGKTTTMATLVQLINQNRDDHIITIEHPIETIYTPQKCQITQREINAHTLSQENALRAALREDPDILVVSELRDLPTIQLAISASETGHLVFGTMNTVNAIQTISRVVDSFPTDEQPVIRNMISESLRGVICQQLIPKKDGTGMVAAYEVLIINSSVANLIREGRFSQINNVLVTGKSFGMVHLDHSLQNLLAGGIISAQEYSERASSNPVSTM